jgi:hypothetical protein
MDSVDRPVLKQVDCPLRHLTVSRRRWVHGADRLRQEMVAKQVDLPRKDHLLIDGSILQARSRLGTHHRVCREHRIPDVFIDPSRTVPSLSSLHLGKRRPHGKMNQEDLRECRPSV